MQKQTFTRETWLDAYHELVQVMADHGIPEEVTGVIARNLHAERSIRRMTAYMHCAHPRSMEEIADEMIAIMEDREHWLQKKQAEESSRRYNAWLNSPERLEDE